MARRLNISIRPDGSIVAEASGTPGPDCLGAIPPLEAMLRAEVIDSRPTPEFDASTSLLRLNNEHAQGLEDYA
ncbi:DUF2997 domain-containing protein [Microbacterium sp. YY-03]|uniref:DUF2997 domain-containing protein n=1 Tax=Microbacterium sp. YY-03 TaxID=3421636 RepID=UPI003D17129B